MLKVEQVAEILKLHQETIRRKLISGEIKGFKIGKQWRIEEKEIERLKRGE